MIGCYPVGVGCRAAYGANKGKEVSGTRERLYHQTGRITEAHSDEDCEDDDGNDGDNGNDNNDDDDDIND